MRVERPHQRAIGERHARAEQVRVAREMRLEQPQEIGEVRFDPRDGGGRNAERGDAPAHPVGEARGGLRVARAGSEIRAGLGFALREVPAVVHGRQHQELVGVELEEQRDGAQQGRARVERRSRHARLERVEDLAGVLPGLVLGRDQDRDEGEARARNDHVSIGRAGRELLDVGHRLVAQRRTHLGREVGDLGGVEQERLGGAHATIGTSATDSSVRISKAARFAVRRRRRG